MEWDLGGEGVALLCAMSLGFGVIAGLGIGGGVRRRLWTVVLTSAACLLVGAVVSEGLVARLTDGDPQPTVDGLSTNEVILAQALTVVLVLVAGAGARRRRERQVTRLPTVSAMPRPRGPRAREDEQTSTESPRRHRGP